MSKTDIYPETDRFGPTYENIKSCRWQSPWWLSYFFCGSQTETGSLSKVAFWGLFVCMFCSCVLRKSDRLLFAEAICPSLMRNRFSPASGRGAAWVSHADTTVEGFSSMLFSQSAPQTNIHNIWKWLLCACVSPMQIQQRSCLQTPGISESLTPSREARRQTKASRWECVC